MNEEQVAAIRARADAATPGPWAWRGNTDTHGLRLQGLRHGWYTVMDFARWGMQSAKPRFINDGFMQDADELVIYEVARNQGLPDNTPRNDPRVYRADVLGVRHPDAEFIAHARTDVPALLDHIRMLQGQLDYCLETVGDAAEAVLGPRRPS